MNLYCPLCGQPILRLIESVDQGDETKNVATCDSCDIIVNIFTQDPITMVKPRPTIAELEAILDG